MRPSARVSRLVRRPIVGAVGHSARYFFLAAAFVTFQFIAFVDDV